MRIRTLDSLISAYDNSSARRRMEISLSRKQSRMILRCRCTALVSIDTTLLSVFRATYLGNMTIGHWVWCTIAASYLILLSLLLKNFPRMLIAMTRRPPSASISRTVKTVSYKIELPTFLVESVLVATWARMSFIVSLAWGSPFPRIRRRRRILTWRKGSVIPETSCSGLYPVVTSALRCRTSTGTACEIMWVKVTSLSGDSARFGIHSGHSGLLDTSRS